MTVSNKEVCEIFGVNENNVIEINKWYNFCSHSVQLGTSYIEIIKSDTITKFDKLIGKHYDNKNNKALMIYNVDGILKGYFTKLI